MDTTNFMSIKELSPELIQIGRQAKHISILTGAGISAESGIPTFREAQTGLWAQYDPEELATRNAFRRHPQLVWAWYNWRRELVRRASPNPGHFALAQMADSGPQVTLITQNVDGLHWEAGSQTVLELHGNIGRFKCFDHNHPAGSLGMDLPEPPLCPECGSLLRPDVVWFGESLPQETLAAAITAAHTCDLFLVVGTSALVYPAAALPLEAIEHGVFTVEINPQQTPLTRYVDVALCGPAGQILPALVSAIWPDK